jgi:hypothetical protein
MAELFGFEFKRKDQKPELPSFTPPSNTDDGAVVVTAGGAYGTYVDLDGTVRSEAELVTKYREMSLQPECDSAIDEIVNESIAIDEEHPIMINLDDLKVGEAVKKVIRDEFNKCLQLLEFNKFAYEIYRRWYIDGRLYYHVVIDEKDPKAGIKELRYIDPRKIRKVREVQKQKIAPNNPGDATVTRTINEYYIFNDKGFNFGNKAVGPSTTGLKIAKDSVVHVVSGLTDNQGTMVLSYLHKGIKPLNQLRTLEDALVIYRLARAPERRIWYIDVGNLPKMKAEQYVRDIMVKHKNRLIYDASSGEIRDDRKFMTMLEDYWLPRREGGRGTEVTTLPGGQTLGQLDDVLYFQKKFLQTLNVPVSRLNTDSPFNLGRATEITRDELKFDKFVTRLRIRFAMLFAQLLQKQLILKGITTLDDWAEMSNNIRFVFATDNYFSELKNAEMLASRLGAMAQAEVALGKYYSYNWARKNILKQTDEDIIDEDKLIKKEQDTQDPRWINVVLQQGISQLEQNELTKEQINQQNIAMQQQNDANADPEQQAQQQAAQQQQDQLAQAQQLVQQLKSNPSRSIADEAKLKQAQQIINASKAQQDSNQG